MPEYTVYELMETPTLYHDSLYEQKETITEEPADTANSATNTD